MVETKFKRSREQLQKMGYMEENMLEKADEEKCPPSVIRPQYKSDNMQQQASKNLPDAHRNRLDFNKPLGD